jgi:hypothetical protein
MKTVPRLIITSFFIALSTIVLAQKYEPLPHGMTFGTHPSNVSQMAASKLEAFMDMRTRTSAVIYGVVLKVTKQQGGWFDLDAGNGKVISAHFTNYKIKLPLNLKGRQVIIEGIAAKQFIADDLQHIAGDTVSGKKQHGVKTNPKQKITFEVKGLMVNK